jgi:hypothetical protein
MVKKNEKKKNPLLKYTGWLIVASVAAVIIFYIISPKYWWALTLASPIPPIP